MGATISVGSGEMPAIGLGLWKIAREDTAAMVRSAIAEDYRHLDSAADYGNEAELGRGLQRAISEGLCSIEELWITSKLYKIYRTSRKKKFYYYLDLKKVKNFQNTTQFD